MNVISFDIIPSTNEYCARNISSLTHGDVITARRQSAGRGRKSRKWSSEEGGLYFSLVLKEGLSLLKSPGTLTQLMALAVCKAARRAGAEAYIKWPNDVLAQGRKFCGILSEAVFEGQFLKAVIVGVGINLSQKELNSDKPAVTLAELGVKADAEVLLKEIIDNFNFNFDLLKRDGFEALRSSYKEAFLYLGKPVKMHIFEETVQGTAEDIDAEGRLILRQGETLRVINIGDMDF